MIILKEFNKFKIFFSSHTHLQPYPIPRKRFLHIPTFAEFTVSQPAVSEPAVAEPDEA